MKPLHALCAALLTVAALAPAVAAPDPARLLADAPRSGAITMMPGEVYIGPGPMTVGYLGAKKQLVLPPGRWTLLAVGERPSRHPTPVTIVSMVFARTEGAALKTMLSFDFNGRPVPVRSSWTETLSCAREGPPKDGQKVQRTAEDRQGCGWVRWVAQWPDFEDPAWDRALAALVRLGHAPPAGRMSYTRAWAWDRGNDYLTVRRIDFPQPGDRLRADWLEAYLDPMVEGFQRRLTAEELEPGREPGGARLQIPD